ncbi:antibiotic biosynthesis monooxygenase [Pseudomonas gingeri]|uniref:Antibiotic biosynthesis monooxygenase n=1 Tax=Pseudomonas gingeri TaxID=117681 RepID=A0A7Y8BQJ0_9PSED|nr:antibiotic biosynthesis monooxygenase [Pseudomonas gingeri]NWB84271.1 antibiotic biosynthesis monooxygenase [Pseudomonas gingeri]
MPIAAINTIEIETVPGRAGEVGTKLSHIVHALLNSSGCMGYGVADNHAVENAWIVSGYWHSEVQMLAHFNQPELMSFMELLNSGLISRIHFNSFVLGRSEVECHVGE